MTRVWSGAALLALVTAVVWMAPAPLFLVAAEALLVLALVEYIRLARACGVTMTAAPAGAAAVLACAAFGGGRLPLDVILMLAFVIVAGSGVTNWRGGRDALGSTAAAVLPTLYLGLPIGAMVAIRETRGRSSPACGSSRSRHGDGKAAVLRAGFT